MTTAASRDGLHARQPLAEPALGAPVIAPVADACCASCGTVEADVRVVPEARAVLLRRALRLEYLTVGWNIVEGLVAIAAGMAAGSVALLGFGIDSFVESASGSVLIWRLRRSGARPATSGWSRWSTRPAGSLQDRWCCWRHGWAGTR